MPLAVVALAGLLAYSNALHGAFVFDDDTEIVMQPLIRNLDNFIGSWNAYHAYPNRVLVYFTFALNYAVGGLQTTGYHAVNILVHVGTALLVYALLALSFRTPHLRRSAMAPSGDTVALVGALLFVTHPLQTQAVTFVTQRLTSLATFFYVLGVVLYVRWRLARDLERAGGIAGAALYAGVLASALGAMKSKEIALTLPVMISVYELAFFEGPLRRRFAWLLPILATTAIIPIGIFGLHQPLAKVLADASDMRLQTDLSRLDYLATQFTVVAHYLRLLVLPVGQNLDYDWPVYRSFLEPRVAFSGLLLLALAVTAAAIWSGRPRKWTRRTFDPASRLIAFGILWFFVALALESSVFPIADVIFEHRVYLPSVGVIMAGTTLWVFMARRIAPARAHTLALAAGVVVSAALGVTTIVRNDVWASDLTLWTDVVAKSPGKSRARDNLGLALAHERREAEAIVQFREAVRIDPANVRAWDNMGVALVKTGRRDEAVAAFMTALRVDPGHASAYYNMGRIRLDEGQFEQAAALFAGAISRRRDYAEAYGNLAAAWNQLGRYDDTIRLLEGASDVISGQPEAHFNLGVAYVVTGNRIAAEGEIRILAGLAPPLSAQLAQFASHPPPGRAGGL